MHRLLGWFAAPRRSGRRRSGLHLREPESPRSLLPGLLLLSVSVPTVYGSCGTEHSWIVMGLMTFRTAEPRFGTVSLRTAFSPKVGGTAWFRARWCSHLPRGCGAMAMTVTFVAVAATTKFGEQGHTGIR